ncbi:ribose-phosphate pyrophosphokinase [Cetobacterium sp.]|uniref:ribose-phosphate pyrophosphokinase n=1 Tax=Cetobacterium sp. TaxID=2071632 RepID=UPI003F3E8772
MAGNQMEVAKKPLSFKVGTGKDAKIFLKVIVEEDGEKNYYNIPLLTLNSIQVFSTKAKVPRYTFGSPDPKGMSTGIRNVSGYITATTLNESIGSLVRDKLRNFKPVEASNLELDTDGYISITQLEDLRHLDQLPPSQINIYIKNPESNEIFSKTIYGVVFTNESHSIGGSATMGEQYSFGASDIGPIRHEEISEEK